MAVSKKMTRYIVVIIVLVIVLVTSVYIYNAKMVSEDEAKLADITMPFETRTVKNAVDLANRTKLRWKDAVEVHGWICKETPMQEERDLFLVLKSRGKTVVYEVAKSNISRPDVTKALHLDTVMKTHGYKVTFPVKDLEGGSYKLGYIIEDRTGKYYVSSGKILIIPSGNDSAVVVKTAKEPSTLGHQVAMSISKPNRKLNWFLDKIKMADDYVVVNGWGFLEGMDATPHHTYLLMKKDNIVSVFDVTPRVRKDVTKVFIKDKLNLDSCGFTSSIPVDNLPKGKYQLGLYISKGDQTGMVYTGKFVEIGN